MPTPFPRCSEAHRLKTRRRSQRARSGQNLVELLIGLLLALLTGAALFSLMSSNYASRSAITGQNNANASARQPLDTLADTLRNAQSFPVGAGYQALIEADASDVKCYILNPDKTPGTSRIWLDTSVTPHILRRIKNDGAAQTLVIGLQSLRITYYTPAGNAYNAANAAWSECTDPNSNLPNIGAANIQATFSNNGNTRTLESFVRLRNSPYARP